MCPLHVLQNNRGFLKNFNTSGQTTNLTLAKFTRKCILGWNINVQYNTFVGKFIFWKKNLTNKWEFSVKKRFYDSYTVKNLLGYFKRGLEVLGWNFPMLWMCQLLMLFIVHLILFLVPTVRGVLIQRDHLCLPFQYRLPHILGEGNLSMLLN